MLVSDAGDVLHMTEFEVHVSKTRPPVLQQICIRKGIVVVFFSCREQR